MEHFWGTSNRQRPPLHIVCLAVSVLLLTLWRLVKKGGEWRWMLPWSKRLKPNTDSFLLRSSIFNPCSISLFFSSSFFLLRALYFRMSLRTSQQTWNHPVWSKGCIISGTTCGLWHSCKDAFASGRLCDSCVRTRQWAKTVGNRWG